MNIILGDFKVMAFIFFFCYYLFFFLFQKREIFDKFEVQEEFGLYSCVGDFVESVHRNFLQKYSILLFYG